jgi:hypothetical protein
MKADGVSIADRAPARLRWYQWRLRSMFILTFLVALGMSWLRVVIDDQRQQNLAGKEITKARGVIRSEQTWLANSTAQG